MKNTYHIATYAGSDVRIQIMSAIFEEGTFDALVRLCFNIQGDVETEMRSSVNINGEMKDDSANVEAYAEVQGYSHEMTKCSSMRMLNHANLSSVMLQLNNIYFDNDIKGDLERFISSNDHDSLHESIVKHSSSVLNNMTELKIEKE